MSEYLTNEMRWYVVHTYSGYENRVKANLEKIVENRGLSHLICDIRIPTEISQTEEDESGKQTADSETPENSEEEKSAKEKEVKLFPCYVLVKMIMSDATWHVVRNVTGVTGFVGPGSRPIPLSDAEVDALGVDVHYVSLDFNVGDTVKIESGPMANFTGTVQEISSDKKKATVLVSIFGRETPVELDTSTIKSVL